MSGMSALLYNDQGALDAIDLSAGPTVRFDVMSESQTSYGYYNPSEENERLLAEQLENHGIAVNDVEMREDAVIVDFAPAGRLGSATVSITAIIAILAMFGIAVAGVFIAGIIERAMPLIVAMTGIGAIVALAYIIRPPPGGEQLLAGVGRGISTTARTAGAATTTGLNVMNRFVG